MHLIYLPPLTIIARHFYYPSGTAQEPCWEYECAPHPLVHAFGPNRVLYTGHLAEMQIMPFRRVVTKIAKGPVVRYTYCEPEELVRRQILAMKNIDDVFNTTISMQEIPLSRRLVAVVQTENAVCLHTRTSK